MGVAEADLPRCTCASGHQAGTNPGDKVCEWSGGNCSAFREGCDKPCIFEEELEVADAALPRCTCASGHQAGTNPGDKPCVFEEESQVAGDQCRYIRYERECNSSPHN